MSLQFTKMQALGNDFIVVDGVNQTFALSAQQIKALADRRKGIGFDQLLLLETATDPDAQFRYRIFNADGGEVAQCGNGARCVGRFIVEQQLSENNPSILQTAKGLISCEVIRLDWVKVSLGIPEIIASEQALTIDQEQLILGIVSVGNPHAIIEVEDIERVDVARLGPAIETHEFFPEGVNVSFVQFTKHDKLLQRVWERGAGITPACGSAACAAVIMGRRWRKLTENVMVSFPGGDLQVSWAGDDHPVYLTGPAETVFVGKI
jgi:diaminopimelate epimerase